MHGNNILIQCSYICSYSIVGTTCGVLYISIPIVTSVKTTDVTSSFQSDVIHRYLKRQHIVLLLLPFFIMTCTLYTGQYRSK